MSRFTLRRGDQGFTMIELLVVMLILGILAAIAVPVFINQTKMDRDRDTAVDVNVAASAVRNMLIQNPQARYYGYDPDASGTFGVVFLDTNGNGQPDAGEPQTKIDQSKGTKIAIQGTGPGSFRVYGWNPAAKIYNAQGATLAYDSMSGGLKAGTTISPIPAAS